MPAIWPRPWSPRAARRPPPAVLVLGAEADAAHAASMAALGLLSRRWRRAALTDALIAATLTVVGIALARADPGEPAASGWRSVRNRYADRLTGLGPTADAEA